MTTEFANRLKLARKQAGLSQIELAEKVGISQSTLASLELRAKGTSSVVLLAIALDVEPLWLSTGEGPMRVKRSEQDVLLKSVQALSKHVEAVPAVLRPSARDALTKWSQESMDDSTLVAVLQALVSAKAPADS